MTDYNGTIQIWSNKEATHEKAPKWQGNFVAHRDIKAGEEIDVALWRNDSNHPKAPVMKGKIGDRRAPQQPTEPVGTPPEGQGDFDSDIPF